LRLRRKKFLFMRSIKIISAMECILRKSWGSPVLSDLDAIADLISQENSNP
jgi:hypothetical protein